MNLYKGILISDICTDINERTHYVIYQKLMRQSINMKYKMLNKKDNRLTEKSTRKQRQANQLQETNIILLQAINMDYNKTVKNKC